jgi:hypothetical protein
MDRCYISALIYGKLSNLTEYELSLIYDIHRNLYSILEDIFDVTICIMTRSKPFSENDDSVYEATLNWNDINNGYLQLVEIQKTNKQWFFTNEETLILINRDKILTDNEVCDYILMRNEENVEIHNSNF